MEWTRRLHYEEEVGTKTIRRERKGRGVKAQKTHLSNDGVIGGGDCVEDSVTGLEIEWRLERYPLLFGHVIVAKRPTHMAVR